MGSRTALIITNPQNPCKDSPAILHPFIKLFVGLRLRVRLEVLVFKA